MVDAVLIVAVLLPWGVIALLAWLLYQVLRQHGRALLNQEELRERLATAEQRLHDLAERVSALDAVALAAPRATVAQANGAVAREDPAPAPAAPSRAARNPDELPIGTPAPDFVLPDLEGRERRLQEFLGRPLLVVFFNPQCGFCSQMAPRLGQLPAAGPRVLLLSRGDPEEHRRLAAQHGWQCEVVLDREWEVTNAFRVAGTPMGYLLDAEGRIASGLAAGADEVLGLLASAPTERAGRKCDCGRHPAGVDCDCARAEKRANGQSEPDLTASVLRQKQEAAAARAREAGLAVRESTIPREGLEVGTPAPDFTLLDLDGAERSLSMYEGSKVLLVFSDPHCGPCDALAPELVKLQQRHRHEGLQVLMVARGDVEANRAKAQEHGFSFPVVLQRNWEISKAYAMFGTPVAYLIDESGRIARPAAVGRDAILQLV